MNKLRAFLYCIGCFLLFPSLTNASQEQPCSNQFLNSVGRQLQQNGWRDPAFNQNTGTLVDAACKAWPNDKSKTVVVLAYAPELAYKAVQPGERNLKIFLAMTEAASGRVLSSYMKDEGEDPTFELSSGGLKVDTARWNLAPGLRAFGYINNAYGSATRYWDFYGNKQINLFVPNGSQLRPVLSQYLYQAVQNDAGEEVGEADLAIMLGKASSNGFVDLIVSAKITAANGRQRTVRKTIRYNGSSYPEVNIFR